MTGCPTRQRDVTLRQPDLRHLPVLCQRFFFVEKVGKRKASGLSSACSLPGQRCPEKGGIPGAAEDQPVMFLAKNTRVAISCSIEKGLCCTLVWVSFPGSADTPNSPFLLQFPTQVTLCAPPAPLPLG